MGVSMKFTDLDQYLFGQGTNYEVYKKLGAHPTTYRRKKGVYFAVWAPNAQSVSVIGEFNDWEEEANPMEKVGPIGVYEVFVPGAKIGQLYKFFIVGAHGEKLYKADPYANEAELRPGTASRITDITGTSISFKLRCRSYALCSGRRAYTRNVCRRTLQHWNYFLCGRILSDDDSGCSSWINR